jgi:two-component system LytT family response regulator
MNDKNLIRCLVLDDEPLAAKLVSQYVEKTEGLELVMKATKVSAVLKKMQDEKIDLVFLDIQMPEMNGIELMKMINKECYVILTTAYPEYALDGFEHDAVDYLLKPITYDRFIKAVNKVKTRSGYGISKGTNDYIYIKSGHRIQRISFSSVFFIEALRDYIAFHTDHGKILSLENMKDMENVLPADLFTRIHKSYIINKSKIEFFEKWKVVISNHHLPVGETYRTKLLSELKDNRKL